MNCDIRLFGNVIDGRQGWAYACNSGELTVLVADTEKHVADNGYTRFGKVRVVRPSTIKGSRDIKVTGNLEVEGGKWSIGGHGCCLSSRFCFDDKAELIENANTPIVKAGDVVAIALINKSADLAALMLFKVGKIDTNCMVMADLTPLTEEEANEIKKKALEWCNR